jgi:predicted dehydrogenase
VHPLRVPLGQYREGAGEWAFRRERIRPVATVDRAAAEMSPIECALRSLRITHRALLIARRSDILPGMVDGEGNAQPIKRQSVPVLLVGVGVRGRMWARILASEPGVHVVGYVDPDPDARAWVRETIGEATPCFPDHAEALGRLDPALAVVATPPMERRDLCIALADAGCTLLVEKPLAVDLGDAVAIAEHCQHRGQRCFIAVNFRYSATTIAARSILQRGDLGSPDLACLTYWRNRNGWAPGLNKYPLTMRQPMLWEQSVHHLDLIRHIYATEVATVSATTSNPRWSDYADDATVCATLTLANGMTVQYTGTWASRTARDTFHWRTDCERGALVQTALFDGLHIVHDGTEAMEYVPLPVQEPFMDDVRLLLRAALHDLHTGDGRAPTVADHLRTLAVTAAIEASAAQGIRVHVPSFAAAYNLPIHDSPMWQESRARPSTQFSALSSQH